MRISIKKSFSIAGLALISGLSCGAAFAQDSEWIKLKFDKIEDARTDPDGVWSNAEIEKDTQSGFSILNNARYNTDRGTYVVSVFWSDACGMSECPVRVLFTPEGKTAGKIVSPTDYVPTRCQSTDHYYIRDDGSAIRACDSILELSTP